MHIDDILRTHMRQWAEKISASREAQFWLLQSIGWVGLCAVSFLSLTLWYETPRLSHIIHTALQAGMGMVLSLCLRRSYQYSWGRGFWLQIFVVLLGVVIVSALWTYLRMQTFLWLAGEYDIWKDFGGWYFSSFLVFSSWSSLYYGVKYFYLFQIEKLQRLHADEILRVEQIKRLSAEAGAREALMKMLRYQLNPHFLFNALNSVQALVKTHRIALANEMIAHLSGFLRFCLDREPEFMVPLAKELEIISLYLNIEKIRYGERLTLTFEVTDAAKVIPVPSLILQPLFENALKYAIALKKEGGCVHFRAYCTAKSLHIYVEDSGPGVHGVSLQSGLDKQAVLKTGVGFKNIISRLQNHYQDNYVFDLRASDLGGVCVYMSVPLTIKACQDERENE